MSDLPFNLIDIVVLAVLAVSALFAFMRGFVHEVLAIAAWVGAALATLYGFSYVQLAARGIIAIDLLADILAGVAIFLAVLVLLAILTRFVASRVQKSSLGALDRSLGLVFGLARGAIIVALAWLVLTWVIPEPQERPEWIQEAKSRRLVEAGADVLVMVLPAEWRGEGAAAVGTARGEAERARALRDTFETLSQPLPGMDAPEETRGYKDQTRDEMDRLIESQTGGAGTDDE